MAKKKKQVLDQWERDAWRPPPEETIDEWAERSLMLPRSVSSITGPLSLDMTPYLRGPLQAVTNPEVEEVDLCTSSQVGKTMFLIIVTLYYLENDPWNMYHVMPTEDEALELKHERYLPIIKASPSLQALVERSAKGQFVGDVIRLNGCSVTFRGSRSASGLASKPVRIAIADEIDKWERWTGSEADPLDLLGERMKTFHDAKFLKCSTPTTKDGRIWAEMSKSSNERYNVPCPHCGEYQPLVFGDGSRDSPGIKWPEGIRDADRIDQENLAWYECRECHDRIDEKYKRQMVMEGVWAPHTATVDQRGRLSKEATGRRRGYHIWAGYSLWPKASWSKIVSKFLKSKGAAASLMNFRNSWLGETWQVTVHELKAQHLKDCVQPYKQGTPPKGARTLTVGVDVQRTGANLYQYYVIRAWGADGQSWLVKAGMSADWSALYAVIFDSRYEDQDGNQLGIEVVLIDSGFATDEVYQFCELYGCWASKGDVRSQRPYTPTETETTKGSGRWLRRVNVNSDYYKSHIHGQITSRKWSVAEDTQEEYYNHMTAEQIVSETEKKTGKTRYRWKILTAGRPNHYLDCEVLAQCGADMLELGHRRPAQSTPQPSATEAPAFQRITSKVFT